MSVSTEERKKRYTHVPFDSMKCPVPGCGLHGSVPGIKRHVGFMHRGIVVSFPPTRTVHGLVDNFLADEEEAERIVQDLGVETLPEDTWEDIAERILSQLGK